MATDDMRFFGFRLPPELAAKMDAVLDRESLQITEYMRGLIREDLRRRGELDKPDLQPQEAGA